MSVNILFIVLLLLLAGGFVWLAARSWRSKRGFIRWPGLVLSGLLALLLLAVAAVGVMGVYRLTTPPHQYTVSDMKVVMNPDQIERGERFAQICVDCHSTTLELPLDGSPANFFEGSPMGVVYGSNLTPGGDLKNWTDGEIMRALREGIDNQGRPLLIMPSQAMHFLSDEDAQAVIAYLRSQPAVERDIPETSPSFMLALLTGAGMFTTSAQEPILEPVVAPQAGTIDYGKYLVYATGCRDCHGLELAGGQVDPSAPLAPNLTTIVPEWSQEDYIRLFREGETPSGQKMTDAMPWKAYSKAFTDQDLIDQYNYLHGLQPVNIDQ